MDRSLVFAIVITNFVVIYFLFIRPLGKILEQMIESIEEINQKINHLSGTLSEVEYFVESTLGVVSPKED